jgi:hypothetical protein
VISGSACRWDTDLLLSVVQAYPAWLMSQGLDESKSCLDISTDLVDLSTEVCCWSLRRILEQQPSLVREEQGIKGLTWEQMEMLRSWMLPVTRICLWTQSSCTHVCKQKAGLFNHTTKNRTYPAAWKRVSFSL